MHSAQLQVQTRLSTAYRSVHHCLEQQLKPSHTVARPGKLKLASPRSHTVVSTYSNTMVSVELLPRFTRTQYRRVCLI